LLITWSLCITRGSTPTNISRANSSSFLHANSSAAPINPISTKFSYSSLVEIKCRIRTCMACLEEKYSLPITSGRGYLSNFSPSVGRNSLMSSKGMKFLAASRIELLGNFFPSEKSFLMSLKESNSFIVESNNDFVGIYNSYLSNVTC
jgi:hypothetical protein